jgi:phospholipase/carboxylesterase
MTMPELKRTIQGLHHGQPVFQAGEPLGQAQAAMLMLHGRGATAEDILTLTEQIGQPGFAYLAPQAPGNTWYPNRFSAPLASNEPWLSSALAVVDGILTQINQAGVATQRIVLLGFSQGASLALEFAARNPRRYGALVGLSGALIGPDGMDRELTGSLENTPVFLGCSDVDPHIPKARFLQAGEALRDLGGDVTLRLYPQMDHTINQDEIDIVRSLLQTLVENPPGSA